MCSSVNKYGGDLNMAPGQSKTTDFAMHNDGTITAASFTLVAGACTELREGHCCDHMLIHITDSGKLVYEGTAAKLAGQTFTLEAPLAPSTARQFTFTAKAPDDIETTGQGGAISQPLT